MNARNLSLTALALVALLVAAVAHVGITFFGFDRDVDPGSGANRDGTNLDDFSFGPCGTTVTVAGSNAEAARNSFRSAISGFSQIGTEDFEIFADKVTAPLSLSFGTTGIKAQLTGSGSITKIQAADSFVHRAGWYPISGENLWDTNRQFLNFGVSDFTPGPVNSFGFYMTDAGDFDGQVVATVSHLSGATEDVTIPHPFSPPNVTDPNDPPDYNSSLLSFGFIDDTNDPVTGFSFFNGSPTDEGDRFGPDDITIAVGQTTPIPEPGTAVMLITGVTLCGLYACKKKLAAHSTKGNA